MTCPFHKCVHLPFRALWIGRRCPINPRVASQEVDRLTTAMRGFASINVDVELMNTRRQGLFARLSDVDDDFVWKPMLLLMLIQIRNINQDTCGTFGFFRESDNIYSRTML